MSIDNITMLDPSDDAVVTVEWNGLGTATIASVSYALPSPLTYSNAGYNNLLSPPISTLQVTGVEHGGMYLCEAQATLSTGEVLNRQFTIRGWNS
jgi:hypothetical protein